MLAACGGGGGGAAGGALPGGSGIIPNSKPTAAPTPTPAPSGGSLRSTPTPGPPFRTPTPQPTPTPLPTATPTPYPSQSPQNLPVLADSSQATTGVFLGAVCTAQTISCSKFANTFRHGIALSVTYINWNTNLQSLFKYTEVGQWNAEGMTPEVTWEPTGLNLADIASGKYDSYIVSAADYLKALGYPVFLRPFHEFNGNWYSWGLPNQGANPQADADFIAAWQHMVNVFRSQGALNVKFVWCFSASALHNLNSWDNPANAYPGDSYVDWVSFDAYNRGSVGDQKNWVSFDQLIAQPYNLSVQIAPNKPVMWAEGASNEYGDGGTMKAAWLQNLFAELSSANNPYPHLREISYFEVDPNPYHYDTLSSTPTFDSFVWSMRAYDQNGVLYIRSNKQVLDNLVTP